MDPPNLGALDLSDSDEDALFDTPAAHKTKKKTKDVDSDAGDGAADGKTRSKESHYTTEEAREAALRRELESIRNVNKVIEGVVASLQKAKDNMAVRDTIRTAAVFRLTMNRLYHALFRTRLPCSRHGLAYFPKPNTTSV
jgi:hypothetical protein